MATPVAALGCHYKGLQFMFNEAIGMSLPKGRTDGHPDLNAAITWMTALRRKVERQQRVDTGAHVYAQHGRSPVLIRTLA
jgi:hypothetical protein